MKLQNDWDKEKANAQSWHALAFDKLAAWCSVPFVVALQLDKSLPDRQRAPLPPAPARERDYQSSVIIPGEVSSSWLTWHNVNSWFWKPDSFTSMSFLTSGQIVSPGQPGVLQWALDPELGDLPGAGHSPTSTPSSVQQRGWAGMITEELSTQSSVHIFLALGFHSVLLKLPLIKIQLTVTARKSKVKGWHFWLIESGRRIKCVGGRCDRQIRHPACPLLNWLFLNWLKSPNASSLCLVFHSRSGVNWLLCFQPGRTAFLQNKEKVSLYFLRSRGFKLVAHGETCLTAQNSTNWAYVLSNQRGYWSLLKMISSGSHFHMVKWVELGRGCFL